MSDRTTVLLEYKEGLDENRIMGFFEEHRALSNFHIEQFKFAGIMWPASENAFQAMKVAAPTRSMLLEFCSMTPAESKKEGRKVPMRPDWDSLKVKMMGEILREKFKQCPYAKRVLLSTSDAHLEECNWWRDTFWGTYGGKGQNWLGRILTDIRTELLAQLSATGAPLPPKCPICYGPTTWVVVDRSVDCPECGSFTMASGVLTPSDET
jgi:hypothetical protein